MRSKEIKKRIITEERKEKRRKIIFKRVLKIKKEGGRKKS